ncbi:MAG: heme-binding protein [Phycisphaeraceae bacterium]|nr:heme-binding protein [Phycisphaeraceae bacterium]
MKRRSILFLPAALAVASLCGLSGCSRSKANWNEQTIRPVGEEPLGAPPSMVHEADLPEGFPAPGPVNQIVIKVYPDHRVAVRRSENDETSNNLFRPLFNHIKENDIAMTAPVRMTYGEEGTRPTSMAFVYASPELGKTGKQKGVEVMDVAPQTVLSIGVHGGYDHERFAEAREKLTAWLQKNAARYVADGPARYLGYNSPFVPPFMKYGEVQIPIRKAKP